MQTPSERITEMAEQYWPLKIDLKKEGAIIRGIVDFLDEQQMLSQMPPEESE